MQDIVGIVIFIGCGVFLFFDLPIGRKKEPKPFPVEKQAKKIAQFAPADLQKVFCYMHFNAGAFGAHFFGGCILFLFGFGVITQGITHLNRNLIMTIVIGTLMYLIWLWLAYFLEKKKDFSRKMLCETKKYLSIENEEEFITDINQDMASNICFLSKNLVITKAYLLFASGDTIRFRPMAVPIAAIDRMEYYYEMTSRSRGTSIQIMIFVTTKDGARMNAWLGTALTGEIPLQALEYYHFPLRQIETKHNG